MTNTFSTDILLKEVLAVLERHSIPVNTVMLDISLLDQDFEEAFPHLKDYKAGVFYKSLIVNDTPTTLRAKRRIPFDAVVQWMEQNVVPFAQEVAAEIEQEFEGIEAKFQVRRLENDPRLTVQYSYHISIECRLRDVTEIAFNTVMLSVGSRQYDATSYPKIYGHVAWLVDEESSGDFGLDPVINLFPLDREVGTSALHKLKNSLPDLRRHLRKEVGQIYDRSRVNKNNP